MTPEAFQQYISDMRASAAKSGQTVPNLNEVQAAINAYASTGQAPSNPTASPFVGNQAKLFSPPNPSPASSAAKTDQPTPQSQVAHNSPLMNAYRQLPQEARLLTQAQLALLPPVPPDMQRAIQGHMASINAKVNSGEMTKDQGRAQLKRLEEMTIQ